MSSRKTADEVAKATLFPQSIIQLFDGNYDVLFAKHESLCNKVKANSKVVQNPITENSTFLKMPNHHWGQQNKPSICCLEVTCERTMALKPSL